MGKATNARQPDDDSDVLSDSEVSSDEERAFVLAEYRGYCFGRNDVPDDYEVDSTATSDSLSLSDVSSLDSLPPTPKAQPTRQPARRDSRDAAVTRKPARSRTGAKGAMALLPKLRCTPLFEEWTDNDLYVAVDAMSNVWFPEGATLWRQGERVGHGGQLYFVLEGYCSGHMGGKEVSYGPGDVVGCNAFEDKVYTTTLITLTAVNALALSKRAYQRVLYRVQTQKQELFVHCLGQTALAKYLPRDRFLALVDLLEEKRYHAKQFPLIQDAECSAITVVLQGSLIVTKKDADGHPKEVGRARGPCVLGEAEFFTGATAALGCQAATELRVAELDRQRFDLLVGPAPDFFDDALLEGPPATAFRPELEGRALEWGEQMDGVASVVEVMPYVQRPIRRSYQCCGCRQDTTGPDPVIPHSVLQDMAGGLVEGCLSLRATGQADSCDLPPPLLHHTSTANLLAPQPIAAQPNSRRSSTSSQGPTDPDSQPPLSAPLGLGHGGASSSFRHLKALPQSMTLVPATSKPEVGLTPTKQRRRPTQFAVAPLSAPQDDAGESPRAQRARSQSQSHSPTSPPSGRPPLATPTPSSLLLSPGPGEGRRRFPLSSLLPLPEQATPGGLSPETSPSVARSPLTLRQPTTASASHAEEGTPKSFTIDTLSSIARSPLMLRRPNSFAIQTALRRQEAKEARSWAEVVQEAGALMVAAPLEASESPRAQRARSQSHSPASPSRPLLVPSSLLGAGSLDGRRRSPQLPFPEAEGAESVRPLLMPFEDLRDSDEGQQRHSATKAEFLTRVSSIRSRAKSKPLIVTASVDAK